MSVPHTLLRLLMEGPTHGYELRRKLSVYRHFYPLSNVNVYPVLKDLEEQGLVSSRSELSDSRVRKVYEITESGITEFEHWIEVPPAASLSAETDLIALKLVLAPSRSGGAGLAWLARSVEELDEEIADWRGYIEARRDAIPRLAMLTAEYRLRCHEQRREFLAEAMRITMAGEHENPDSPPPRILVADDSSASRALTKHLLLAAGYEVQLAEDGVQAWRLLQEAVFDVLVSDALMPELDGFELLRRVRANKRLSELPVIVNTVLDDSEDRDAAIAAGANDYVCKNNADSGRRLVACVDRVTGIATGSGTH
jgi:CheY-like chemotaxis protein/DNA-binding PadR family transcriptional regulator